MKGSEVRLLLQDFCAQETQQKGDGLIALSAGGGELSAAAPAEPRLWSLQTCGLPWIAWRGSGSAGLSAIPVLLDPNLGLSILKQSLTTPGVASDILCLPWKGRGDGDHPCVTHSLAGRQT